MTLFKRLAPMATLMVAALVITSCTHHDKLIAPINSYVYVKVTEGTDPGDYNFEYNGDQVTDPEGDLDFRIRRAKGKPITLQFVIDDGSVSGIEFVKPGRQAIYIDLLANVGAGNSPAGPYNGNEFNGFVTSANGQTLTMNNPNQDGEEYRYALRFKLNGATIVDDPDLKNDRRTGGFNTK